MGVRRNTRIAEQRIYDDPQNPTTSPFDAAISPEGFNALNRIRFGKDLAATFAAEIAASPHNGNVWSWLRARIRAGDYAGINVGDFISFQTTGAAAQTIIAEVAGIDTYRRSGTPAIPRHIDFISRDLFTETMRWNAASYNNGLQAITTPAQATEENPFRASEIFARLNGLARQVPNGLGANPAVLAVDFTTTGILPRLPANLRNVIVEKIVYAPTRFSAGNLLTDDNSANWINMGRLWLPHETEVYGRPIVGTQGAGTTGHFNSELVQYAIFANNLTKTVKGNGSGGERTHWSLASPVSGNSSTVAIVSGSGRSSWNGATFATRVPLCFRIA